jgi:hypothetical protein
MELRELKAAERSLRFGLSRQQQVMLCSRVSTKTCMHFSAIGCPPPARKERAQSAPPPPGLRAGSRRTCGPRLRSANEKWLKRNALQRSASQDRHSTPEHFSAGRGERRAGKHREPQAGELIGRDADRTSRCLAQAHRGKTAFGDGTGAADRHCTPERPAELQQLTLRCKPIGADVSGTRAAGPPACAQRRSALATGNGCCRSPRPSWGSG